MFYDSIWALLKEVILSWQVLAVTVALIIYLNIVFYVSRAYHAPRAKLTKKRKKKNSGDQDVLPVAEETLPAGNSNDELGLEEA